MKIIKLHDAFTGQFIYINSDHIDDFYTKVSDDSSSLVSKYTIIATSYPKSFTVLETPNDIIKLIKGEEAPAEVDKLHSRVCELLNERRRDEEKSPCVSCSSDPSFCCGCPRLFEWQKKNKEKK